MDSRWASPLRAPGARPGFTSSRPTRGDGGPTRGRGGPTRVRLDTNKEGGGKVVEHWQRMDEYYLNMNVAGKDAVVPPMGGSAGVQPLPTLHAEL